MTDNRRIVMFVAVVITVFVIALGLVFANNVSAQQSNDNVCRGDKVEVSGERESVTVTAPEGKLISSYCVKAGSANSGEGPEYVTVSPPAKTVTIRHSSGKAISHYSVTYVNDSTTSTTQARTSTTQSQTTTTLDRNTTTTTDRTTTSSTSVGNTSTTEATTTTVCADNKECTPITTAAPRHNTPGTATTSVLPEDELAETGFPFGILALLGAIMVVAGLLTVKRSQT